MDETELRLRIANARFFLVKTLKEGILQQLEANGVFCKLVPSDCIAIMNVSINGRLFCTVYLSPADLIRYDSTTPKKLVVKFTSGKSIILEGDHTEMINKIFLMVKNKAQEHLVRGETKVSTPEQEPPLNKDTRYHQHPAAPLNKDTRYHQQPAAPLNKDTRYHQRPTAPPAQEQETKVSSLSESSQSSEGPAVSASLVELVLAADKAQRAADRAQNAAEEAQTDADKAQNAANEAKRALQNRLNGTPVDQRTAIAKFLSRQQNYCS